MDNNHREMEDLSKQIYKVIEKLTSKVKENADRNKRLYTRFDEINKSLSIGSESSLLKLEIAKSFSLLNWQPRLTIDECASMTSNWYLKFKNGVSAEDLCNKDIDFYIKKYLLHF